MKLFVDDIRPAPEGWQQARTVTDAIRFLDMFGHDVTEVSLDHDISYAVEVAGTQRPFPSPENFTAVARYLAVRPEKFQKVEHVIVHSANPVGATEIMKITSPYYKTIVSPASRVNRLESEV